jgi:hypothetical protein
MATTTNYGWTTPDDTDLVKDGAAAIRTLGSSVDTTTKNLNPETTTGDIAYRSATANVNTRLPLGTAGQVLKVNSGATAPEWATDASGMTNPMTTTGDSIYSSSGSTPARLGIGTAGQVLTVNSGATAPEWATPAGGGKVLQVVSSTITTETQITTTSLADTGITATITPTSATSKILVLISQLCQADGSTNEIAIGAKLLRGATTILNYGDYGFQIEYDQNATFFTTAVPGSISYYDSPATTSATTYKVQAKLNASGSGRQASFQYDGSPSTITLLEIGA